MVVDRDISGLKRKQAPPPTIIASAIHSARARADNPTSAFATVGALSAIASKRAHGGLKRSESRASPCARASEIFPKRSLRPRPVSAFESASRALERGGGY